MKLFKNIAIAVLCFTLPAFADFKVEKGDKKLPLKGESFKLNGRDAFVIMPEKADKDTPWVWYAPTLKGLPSSAEVWMFEQFLANGIAIAGIDIGESYGSLYGRELYSGFYDYLVAERKFSTQPCLLARSRGGLMLYNWAVENPEKVAGVAGIYPVCNLTSYPGIKKTAKAYELTVGELEAELEKHNPIDRIKPLAEAGVPILHLQGDSDKVVPHEKNTKILVERYKKFGGIAELELIKGQGHNMWKGWFQSQKLTDFVIARAKAAKQNPLNKLKLPGIKINTKERFVDVDAKVCLREGALELVVCTKGTKEHESIFSVEARPMHVHLALLIIGAKSGNPAGRRRLEGGGWLDVPPRGGQIDFSVVVTDKKGKAKETPIQEFMVSTADPNEKFPTSTFLFAGSRLIPQENGPKLYLCEQSGNVISLSTFGDELLCLPDVHGHQNGALLWEVVGDNLPKIGKKVILRLRPKFAKANE
ncbi:MAG: YdjY domain-containing protein [Akkermansiaceae bacterium]